MKIVSCIFHQVYIPSALLVIAILYHASSAAADDLPPVRTEVTYQPPKEQRNDDPEDAWAEWGETKETRKNPFPKRQRNIEVGMDINSILGMAMKQPKVLTAVLAQQFSPTDRIGNLVTQKFRNQMAAAGIGCRLWYVHDKGRQVVANCETIRDGHQAKDYMIRQPEIIRTVLDNVAFTPLPVKDEDDDDNDDNDIEKESTKTDDISDSSDKSVERSTQSQSSSESKVEEKVQNDSNSEEKSNGQTQSELKETKEEL